MGRVGERRGREWKRKTGGKGKKKRRKRKKSPGSVTNSWPCMTGIPWQLLLLLFFLWPVPPTIEVTLCPMLDRRFLRPSVMLNESAESDMAPASGRESFSSAAGSISIGWRPTPPCLVPLLTSARPPCFPNDLSTLKSYAHHSNLRTDRHQVPLPTSINQWIGIYIAPLLASEREMLWNQFLRIIIITSMQWMTGDHKLSLKSNGWQAITY